jgi:O-6-methylguanine DNA methyltransferase
VQVRRTFKRHFGMTFQAYQRACRLGTAMKALHGGARTLDAGLDAGFESDSGFREAFAKVFGDAPGRARDTALLVASWIETPLGPMLAIAGDEGLELLEFVDRRALETELRELGRKWKRAIVPGEHPLLERTAAQLAEYFKGARREFDIPLRLQGSPFQVAAWKALATFRMARRGRTPTWRARVGSPGAVRAIGRANGQNRLCIVVPCHRVIQCGRLAVAVMAEAGGGSSGCSTTSGQLLTPAARGFPSSELACRADPPRRAGGPVGCSIPADNAQLERVRNRRSRLRPRSRHPRNHDTHARRRRGQAVFRMSVRGWRFDHAVLARRYDGASVRAGRRCRPSISSFSSKSRRSSFDRASLFPGYPTTPYGALSFSIPVIPVVRDADARRQEVPTACGGRGPGAKKCGRISPGCSRAAPIPARAGC